MALRDDMAPGATPGPIVPRSFAEANAMCQALATADLVPRAFRGKPVDMLLVVMTGLEVGLPPMASLRLYTTWDGVARLMAEGVRAVILRHPDIEYFEPQSSSETSATWIAKRRGRPEKSATWTHERARKAGLLSKPVWQAYEEDMLNARASMQLGRMIAPDVIAGMISHEEARDGDFIEANAVEVKPAAFVAPPAPAVVPAPTVTPAEKPKAKAKPVEAPVPTPPPPSADSASASAGATSNCSAPPSAASTASKPEPSKLDAAVQKVEAKKPTVDQWGQNIGAPDAPAAAAAPTTSGAAADAAGEAQSDGFGDDPVDAGPPPSKLADFHAWVASCKTQRDLQAGLSKWRTWSQDEAKKGDASFSKDGANTIEMQTAYSRRKGEVPA